MLVPNLSVETARGIIVTTATSAGAESTRRAAQIASELHVVFVTRRNGHGGLAAMLAAAGAERAVIVEENGLALAHHDGTVFRWHPNMGFVRALNLLRGQSDTLARAAEFASGERVLDCTLGFAGEAIIAALLVGQQGQVVGLESSPELALVTAAGLRERRLSNPELLDAARRITVVNADYREYLAGIAARRFDVICFDPFFASRLDASAASIDPLHRFGNTAPLDAASVLRAVTLAGRCVLVKHPTTEELPDALLAARTRIVKAKRGVVRYSVFAAAKY